MEAKQLVLNARSEYLKINQDEQFKKAFEKVESLRVEADEEQPELKGYDPDDDLTNYVMNKLLELARKEGGNMFMGDSSQLNEFIFEFYTDYENLKADDKNFSDKWNHFIRGVSNTPTSSKKKKDVADTLADADVLAAKEKKLEEEFKKKEAAIRKQAIADYKAEEKAKKEEQTRLKEEAKLKEQEESEMLGGMFDLL